MTLVVGGVVPPHRVVGRASQELEALNALAGGGAVFVGDRRYGKTSLARRVLSIAKAGGNMTAAVSAERQTFSEFVNALADAIGAQSSALRHEVENWKVKIGVGPVQFERQQASSALDDLITRALNRHPGRRLVLLIDEVTVLARTLERASTGDGNSFLHLLRRLRQDHPGRVATLLSGSIGFHHVARDTLATVNDIPKIAVGRIDNFWGPYLAECLLLGEQVATSDRWAVANAIAAAADGIPYYIQRLVQAAKAASRTSRITPETIGELRTLAIHDPHDPWDLRHYRDRLPDYYGDRAIDIAAILDIYAHATASVPVPTVLKVLQNQGSQISDHAELVQFVERLEQDHYLRRTSTGDVFASNLLAEAWKAIRR